MIWSVSSVDRAFDKRSRGNGLTPIRADPCNYPSVSTSIEIDQHASFHSFPQHYLEAILDPARSPPYTSTSIAWQCQALSASQSRSVMSQSYWARRTM